MKESVRKKMTEEKEQGSEGERAASFSNIRKDGSIGSCSRRSHSDDNVFDNRRADNNQDKAWKNMQMASTTWHASSRSATSYLLFNRAPNMVNMEGVARHSLYDKIEHHKPHTNTSTHSDTVT